MPPTSNTASTSITHDSDLRRLDRKIWIVTTAALPWRTGTSVNPLARALVLTRKRPKHSVTLLVPWLANPDDQSKLFGEKNVFSSQEDQEKWIRQYCIDRVHCETEEKNLRIRFYPAFYHGPFGSIFPTVDICALIPFEEADVAILEEPEHLTWFRVPPKSMESDLGERTGEEAVSANRQELAELGWQFKFKHVVGILHTNYSAYMQQYGMGTSFITAPALSSLSSMVVRAYCHRVIRLSGTLPELVKDREVTLNVHGVRSEFFERPNPNHEPDHENPSPIYFIGKLVWAKGFDKLLDIQDKFKKEGGNYFPIDIYGSGSDSSSLKLAFLGRKGIIRKVDTNVDIRDKEDIDTPQDKKAASIFGACASLRTLLDPTECCAPLQDVQDEREQDNTPNSQDRPPPKPFEILGSLTGKSMETGLTATSAVGKLAEDLVELGFLSTFQKNTASLSEDYRFEPIKSKYELRRNPVPARFLGTLDHAIIRDIPDHKIFLNLSETEVLCTTTAEALAMGKFVIIPSHPSNEFFLAFPNCLAFSSPEECVEKIKWALRNEPEPLSGVHRKMLTWEGANERLFEAAAVTTAEAEEKEKAGENEMNKSIARKHIKRMKRLRYIQNFFK